jgi:Flp pilus assembly protein TadG
MPAKHFRPTSRKRRGATLLEAAFVMIPMVVLVVGSTDFLLGLFVRNTLQHSVREGCRYAVTSRTGSGLGHVDSIKQYVRANSLGFVATDDQVTVKFFDESGRGEVTGFGANTGGNIVQVSINNYRWRWIAGAFTGTPDLNITVTSSDVLEPSPNGVPPAL